MRFGRLLFTLIAILAIILQITVLSNTASAATGTFGLNSGNTLWTDTGNVLNAMRFQNTAYTGNITRLEILYNTSAPNGKVRLGVYADNNGKPGNLLLDAGETNVANSWVSISGLSLNVTKNSYYWLAFNQQSSNGVSFVSSANNITQAAHYWVNGTAYGPLPASFNVTASGNNLGPYVMRATVEETIIMTVLPPAITMIPPVVTTKPPENSQAQTIRITPDVSRSEATYDNSDAAPEVKFQSGDVVTIIAGGGVQTGGVGKTWKRYVNPSGGDSDHLYYGQIFIPGVMTELRPIRDLIPEFGSYDSQSPDRCILTFNIPSFENIPESSQYLVLGYVDDGYGDNGYYSHDDGTDDQCKGIGQAYVEVKIERKSNTANPPTAPPAQGVIRITPDVNRGEATYDGADAYPEVKFQSGDIVTITAGGGVQTGGTGRTWKRYVNPSGGGSDHLYYGTIYIPGITSGLTPIRDLVPIYGGYDGQSPDRCILTFTLPNLNNIPESNRYMILGYVDDGYGDNGYYSHDDGTEDQCKNVGQAYVDIKIEHATVSQKTLQFPPIVPNVTTGAPIVYNGISANPSIGFQPGDKVTVVAGGGVQTGGSGRTWKRYVNPSGGDSDHLYFGTIHIPGITSGLTPIRDLVELYGAYDIQSPDKCILVFTIPNLNNVPASNRYLALGYVDDGYGDNGYYAHDDGTEDQCKNVGNAYVSVTIQR